jgi:hypothetical protein
MGRGEWSLRRRVAAATGADLTLSFVHDGTAAAATAGSMNSATITAGTWLGVGFRPADGPPLLDVAPNVWIEGGPSSHQLKFHDLDQVGHDFGE